MAALRNLYKAFDLLATTNELLKFGMWKFARG